MGTNKANKDSKYKTNRSHNTTGQKSRQTSEEPRTLTMTVDTYLQCKFVLSKLMEPISETKSEKSVASE